MKTTEIERDECPRFYDRISGVLQGKQIKIDIGAQLESRSLSLNGLTYDRKNDVFIVATEVIEHLVREPGRIFVSGDEDTVDSLVIESAEEGPAYRRFPRTAGTAGPVRLEMTTGRDLQARA